MGVVLVTGGTGFIGSRLARRLIASGGRVVCVDAQPDPARLREAAGHPNLSLVAGDITDLAALTAVMRRHGAQHVVHTAAVLTQACQADPLTAVRVNVLGTANVFEAARQCGVARVVYASSLVVHGHQWDHGDRALDDDAPLHPHTFYARTKCMNEHTARVYADQHGLDCRGLRIGAPFGAQGKTGRPGSEVTRMLSLIAVGAPIRVMLDPRETPPSTYIDDIVEILTRLCFAPSLTRAVYVCSVAAVSVDEIAQILRGWVPGAAITFDDPGERVTLPYRIDARRLEADIDYQLPPIERRLRDHLNEVRLAAGLAPLAAVAR
jgi:nucleoside-diphosphate-sugar epimerase